MRTRWKDAGIFMAQQRRAIYLQRSHAAEMHHSFLEIVRFVNADQVSDICSFDGF